MRVLAIAQFLAALEHHRQRLGEPLALVSEGEPAGDGRIILRGQGIGLGGEALAVFQRGFASRDHGIVGGIGDDRDEGVVLGGGAHHRGAADIDILDNLVAACALGDGLGEGVEVDHDQVDHADRMFAGRSHVAGIIAHREQAAMDDRVQRLDAAIHHLGKAGEVGDVAHFQPSVAQHL